MRTALGLLAAATILVGTSIASADGPRVTDAAHVDAPGAADAAIPSGSSSPKRAVPDYDGSGRVAEPPNPTILYVPRVILFPLYALNEYAVRAPLAAIVPWAERNEVPRKIYDFFTLEDPNHKVGFAPVGFIELGFAPSVGIVAFANDAFRKGHSLRVHVEIWPTGSPIDWLAGSFTDTLQLDPDHKLSLRVATIKRPDMLFYGIGPSSLQGNISRYAMDKFDLKASASASTWRSSDVTASLGVRKTSTHDGHLYGDPTLSQEAATGAFPIPTGFNTTELAPYGRLDADFDTRVRGAHGTGVRLELHGQEMSDVEHASSWSELRYGGALAGFVDVNGHGRVLGLTVTTIFADPLTSVPVPFTELVSLGGDNPMPAYLPGRLLGRSAAVATLKYDWPIAPTLAGTLQASTGNVFDAHLSGAKPGLLRLAFALGLSSFALGDSPVEFLLGMGTETVDQGLQLNTARVSLGVPHSF